MPPAFLPHMPTSPAMHTPRPRMPPCHTHPLPCLPPPATHACLPCHAYPLGHTCPPRPCTPPVTHAPLPCIPPRHYDMWSMSGRYASYWNAFLYQVRTLTHLKIVSIVDQSILIFLSQYSKVRYVKYKYFKNNHPSGNRQIYHTKICVSVCMSALPVSFKGPPTKWCVGRGVVFLNCIQTISELYTNSL